MTDPDDKANALQTERRLAEQMYATAERLRHVANDAIATVERLNAENARLRAVIEDLPACAYGPCLKKGIWDFSDTEHGLRVYCQQHAEDKARDIGDFVEHCAELVPYADALGALEKT